MRKLLALTVAALALAGCAPSNPDTKEMACIMSHHYVLQSLKAPSSAEFSSCAGLDAEKDADGWWTVTGYVDAQNSFGAALRTEYQIEMRYDASDESWRGRKLRFV